MRPNHAAPVLHNASLVRPGQSSSPTSLDNSVLPREHAGGRSGQHLPLLSGWMGGIPGGKREKE